MENLIRRWNWILLRSAQHGHLARTQRRVVVDGSRSRAAAGDQHCRPRVVDEDEQISFTEIAYACSKLLE
ncbi:MAG: hypothetical protein WBK63_10955, partial [Bacillota bacterium]